MLAGRVLFVPSPLEGYKYLETDCFLGKDTSSQSVTCCAAGPVRSSGGGEFFLDGSVKSSHFRNARRYKADKDEVFTAPIHKLVFFIAGNENHGTTGDLLPFTVLIDLAFTGMDEYFVLPFMGMSRGKTTRGDGEDSHAKVVGCIFLADDNSAGNAFYCLVFKFMGRGIFIIDDFHINHFTYKVEKRIITCCYK